MNRIASSSGCLLCHSVRPLGPEKSAERPPINARSLPLGPAWSDVAKKYKDQRGAAERLTNSVLKGTGRQSGDRHWGSTPRGMPPNTGEISKVNAQRLVHWILLLEK